MSGLPGNPEETALLSLGSNLGKREETLLRAFARLSREKALRVEALSSLFETSPVGVSAEGLFVNAACAVRTALSPRRLLALCKRIEGEFGRGAGGGARDRTLDIDIVAYGRLVLDEADLAIPHPRMRDRRFVLEPLAEIRPGFPVPPDGKTVLEILRDCAGEGWARRISSRGEIG